MSFISDIARALFDGGWRFRDLNDIMEEYDFTFEQAFEICSELKLLEKKEDNNE